MNKKLFELLKAKCKDMGLSEKAIEEAATVASDGLKDDSPDSDIEAKANLAASFLKTTQGEATRWAQTAKQKAEDEAKKKASDDEAKKKADDEAKKKKEAEEKAAQDEPAWFKTYKEEQAKKLEALETENKSFKAEKSKTERSGLIEATAKKLNIPAWRMKGVVVPDDADPEKFLADIKQDLVTNNLMAADAADSASSKEKASQELAKNLLNELEVKES